MRLSEMQARLTGSVMLISGVHSASAKCTKTALCVLWRVGITVPSSVTWGTGAATVMSFSQALSQKLDAQQTDSGQLAPCALTHLVLHQLGHRHSNAHVPSYFYTCKAQFQ